MTHESRLTYFPSFVAPTIVGAVIVVDSLLQTLPLNFSHQPPETRYKSPEQRLIDSFNISGSSSSSTDTDTRTTKGNVNINNNTSYNLLSITGLNCLSVALCLTDVLKDSSKVSLLDQQRQTFFELKPCTLTASTCLVSLFSTSTCFLHYSRYVVCSSPTTTTTTTTTTILLSLSCIARQTIPACQM